MHTPWIVVSAVGCVGSSLAAGPLAFEAVDDLTGFDTARATGISGDGRILIGTGRRTAGDSRIAFAYSSDDGRLVDLAEPLGSGGGEVACDVDSDGDAVVGIASVFPTTAAGVRWSLDQPAGAVVSVESFPVSPDAIIFDSPARAVSADGRIVAGDLNISVPVGGPQQRVNYRWRADDGSGFGGFDDAVEILERPAQPQARALVRGMSADGTVVGGRVFGTGVAATEAVIWDAAGRLRVLGRPAGSDDAGQWVEDVSGDGRLAVGFSDVMPAVWRTDDPAAPPRLLALPPGITSGRLEQLAGSSPGSRGVHPRDRMPVRERARG